MRKDVLRQWATVVAVIVTIAVNGLASTRFLNGQTTGEVADQYPAYFAPAGYAFAIWAPIYVGLLAFCVYQALPAQRDNPRLRRVGYPFVLSCVANVVWLLLWQYEALPLTLVAMFSLLALLIVVYVRLGTGEFLVTASERWLARVPFSIYLGWISVATVANVSTALVYLGWNGWGIGPEVWAVIMLAVATGIAAAMSFTRRDVAYLLVILWALAAIGVGQADTPLVATAAWVTAGLVGAALVLGLARRPKLKAA